MKRYNQIVIGSLILSIVLLLIMNLIDPTKDKKSTDDLYRIELNRLFQQIQTKGYQEAAGEQYTYLVSIECLGEDASEAEVQKFYSGAEKCCEYEAVTDSSGHLLIVKVCYRAAEVKSNGRFLMNLGMVSMIVLTFAFLWYLRTQIVKPFQTLEQLPLELAKGNLTPGLKESKYHYFGKFLWGLDLLRQKLEEEQKERLELEREKKMLILSISHDINTPVSAIQMSAKALYEELYQDPEKKKELARLIEKNGKKIGDYVAQIKQASKEDFLTFTVEPSEFYLKELMDKFLLLYQERCEQSLTELQIGSYSNQLLAGDFERCLEVLQNVMENALKYGDGRYIRISFDREEEYRLIRICNSGCQFDEKELVHVFDSFFRGSNANNQPGSGLGLYICRQLMQRMDGEIYADVNDREFEVTVVIRIA